MIVGRTERGGVEIHAPAKLNLYLEILGKRPDGYHDLESLMVTVNLADTLLFEDDPNGRITLECDDPRLPTDGSNLVVKAAERLRSVAGVNRGAAITLQKRIPWEAGLAGGSSDAAACLVALDALWELNSPRARLEQVAAEIGSDVSFSSTVPRRFAGGAGRSSSRSPCRRRFTSYWFAPSLV